MHAAEDFDAKRLGEHFDPFHDPFLADQFPFFAEAQAATEDLSARLPQLRLAPGQTFRFPPNTSFRGTLSLLVERDV
jgi:hypothetical protein